MAEEDATTQRRSVKLTPSWPKKTQPFTENPRPPFCALQADIHSPLLVHLLELLVAAGGDLRAQRRQETELSDGGSESDCQLIWAHGSWLHAVVCWLLTTVRCATSCRAGRGACGFARADVEADTCAGVARSSPRSMFGSDVQTSACWLCHARPSLGQWGISCLAQSSACRACNDRPGPWPVGHGSGHGNTHPPTNALNGWLVTTKR